MGKDREACSGAVSSCFPPWLLQVALSLQTFPGRGTCLLQTHLSPPSLWVMDQTPSRTCSSWGLSVLARLGARVRGAFPLVAPTGKENTEELITSHHSLKRNPFQPFKWEVALGQVTAHILSAWLQGGLQRKACRLSLGCGVLFTCYV